MSRFAPVHLPPDRELNGRVSMTFLKHYDLCPRSGYLYAATKGSAQTAHMVRGSAVHAIIERALKACMDNEEKRIPPELAKSIADEVLAETAVPFDQHDAVREMVYRWAAQTKIDPTLVIALETLFTVEIGGYQVRCRIDFAQDENHDGKVTFVKDWKSSRSAPAYEEIARKRPDGTYMAKNFQLILYAWALAHGQTTRHEPCRGGVLVGAGRVEDHSHCLVCLGRGYVEWGEGLPLCSGTERFELEFVYPAIEDRDGNMLRRQVSLSRSELDEYRASFEGLLKRVKNSETTGDWPAVVSDEGCGICPCAQACPIPSEIRDHRGIINTDEQAAEAAEVLDREAAIHKSLRAEIKAHVKANGGEPLRFGRKVWEFVPKRVERIVDRDGMIEAARHEDFNRDEWIRVSNGTDFRSRDLTVDELEGL